MKKIALFLISLFFFSCVNINDNSNYPLIKSTGNKYKCECTIYWADGIWDRVTIYTNDSIYTCSFQGTNFLLEKNNSEELFSSTATIRIKSIKKIK